jgi:hypothetical protein
MLSYPCVVCLINELISRTRRTRLRSRPVVVLIPTQGRLSPVLKVDTSTLFVRPLNVLPALRRTIVVPASSVPLAHCQEKDVVPWLIRSPQARRLSPAVLPLPPELQLPLPRLQSVYLSQDLLSA